MTANLNMMFFVVVILCATMPHPAFALPVAQPQQTGSSFFYYYSPNQPMLINSQTYGSNPQSYFTTSSSAAKTPQEHLSHNAPPFRFNPIPTATPFLPQRPSEDLVDKITFTNGPSPLGTTPQYYYNYQTDTGQQQQSSPSPQPPLAQEQVEVEPPQPPGRLFNFLNQPFQFFNNNFNRFRTTPNDGDSYSHQEQHDGGGDFDSNFMQFEGMPASSLTIPPPPPSPTVPTLQEEGAGRTESTLFIPPQNYYATNPYSRFITEKPKTTPLSFSVNQFFTSKTTKGPSSYTFTIESNPTASGPTASVQVSVGGNELPSTFPTLPPSLFTPSSRPDQSPSVAEDGVSTSTMASVTSSTTPTTTPLSVELHPPSSTTEKATTTTTTASLPPRNVSTVNPVVLELLLNDADVEKGRGRNPVKRVILVRKKLINLDGSSKTVGEAVREETYRSTYRNKEFIGGGEGRRRFNDVVEAGPASTTTTTTSPAHKPIQFIETSTITTPTTSSLKPVSEVSLVSTTASSAIDPTTLPSSTTKRGIDETTKASSSSVQSEQPEDLMMAVPITTTFRPSLSFDPSVGTTTPSPTTTEIVVATTNTSTSTNPSRSSGGKPEADVSGGSDETEEYEEYYYYEDYVPTTASSRPTTVETTTASTSSTTPSPPSRVTTSTTGDVHGEEDGESLPQGVTTFNPRLFSIMAEEDSVIEPLSTTTSQSLPAIDVETSTTNSPTSTPVSSTTESTTSSTPALMGNPELVLITPAASSLPTTTERPKSDFDSSSIKPEELEDTPTTVATPELENEKPSRPVVVVFQNETNNEDVTVTTTSPLAHDPKSSDVNSDFHYDENSDYQHQRYEHYQYDSLTVEFDDPLEDERIQEAQRQALKNALKNIRNRLQNTSTPSSDGEEDSTDLPLQKKYIRKLHNLPSTPSGGDVAIAAGAAEDDEDEVLGDSRSNIINKIQNFRTKLRKVVSRVNKQRTTTKRPRRVTRPHAISSPPLQEDQDSANLDEDIPPISSHSTSTTPQVITQTTTFLPVTTFRSLPDPTTTTPSTTTELPTTTSGTTTTTPETTTTTVTTSSGTNTHVGSLTIQEIIPPSSGSTDEQRINGVHVTIAHSSDAEPVSTTGVVVGPIRGRRRKVKKLIKGVPRTTPISVSSSTEATTVSETQDAVSVTTTTTTTSTPEVTTTESIDDAAMVSSTTTSLPPPTTAEQEETVTRSPSMVVETATSQRVKERKVKVILKRRKGDPHNSTGKVTSRKVIRTRTRPRVRPEAA